MTDDLIRAIELGLNVNATPSQIESARNALGRLNAEVAAAHPQWQPIETAPRDGRQILLFCSDGQCVCGEFWARPDGTAGWEIGHTRDIVTCLGIPATHWMPLPESPK